MTATSMLRWTPLIVAGAMVWVAPLRAQIGPGWVAYAPEKKIHLENFKEKSPTAYIWPSNYESYGNPKTASYAYDAANDAETFQLYGLKGNRSEIRLFNEYETGSRQFEGYVTFFAPLNDESLFQIWGSVRGATQMMLRGFAANNGCIGINYEGGGTPKFLSNLYGREFKVNVIHLQEDVGNKIVIYIDGAKILEFPDNEKAVNHEGKNYHKYGCYGTVKEGHESPKVIWRNVRCFRDGTTPGAKAQSIAFPTISAKSVGDSDFTPNAEASSGLPVSFRSDNYAVAKIVAGKVHLAGQGTATITATQGGDETFSSAANVSQTLTVK
jgi:hypothetical protein